MRILKEGIKGVKWPTRFVCLDCRSVLLVERKEAECTYKNDCGETSFVMEFECVFCGSWNQVTFPIRRTER